MGAPVDSVESKLLEIWRQSIDLDSIELDDDFFDIGGHSLLALKILSQIERAFGQRLALATFLHEPTIRALAARLREERSRSRRDQVIAFHQDGTKAPLILVDTGSYYRPLIRRLGADQPIFGLALPDLQELPRRFQVEDIAANLIEALRDVQPRGPYYMCGWCHAGIIAFEMAQQLIADGEDVPAVMLFDSDDPCYVRQFKTFRALPVRLFFFAEKLVYHFGRLRKSNSKAMIRYTVDRIQTVLQVARQRFWGVFYRTAVHYDYEHLKTSSWFQFLAVAEYHPKPIETPIILFRSHDLQTGRFRDPSLGWGGAAQCGLIVHEMAGNHSAMFEEPGVEALAKAIAALIPVIASEHDPR